ncbi:hypothetical protein FRB97_008982 [Tulasnella sp. 331]|nr:hypothetical protein FRB97_008982 [Tulasnella sp. 331]KAG8882416.1 hypothetical protein FRB98_003722 [Tulasnella sp. 332]
MFWEQEHSHSKPAIVDLMRVALLHSPDRKATLDQICDLITKYYKDSRRYKHLKATVRQRLSLKPCFQLAERPQWQKGKGHFWTYVEELDTDPNSGSGRSARRGSHQSSPRMGHRRPRTRRTRNPSPMPHLERVVLNANPPISTFPPVSQDLSTSVPADIQSSTSHFPAISTISHSNLSGTSSSEDFTTWSAVPTVMTNTACVPSHSGQIGQGGGLGQIMHLLRDLRPSPSPMTGLAMPFAVPALEAAEAPPFSLPLTQRGVAVACEEEVDAFMHQIVNWGDDVDFHNHTTSP